MYKTPICPYCARAESLLKQKGAEVTMIDISTDPALRDEMMQKSGGRKTVPQIFIGERHIGGCDDLYALDKKGELDSLLAA
jgi:glutaredoxin 3